MKFRHPRFYLAVVFVFAVSSGLESPAETASRRPAGQISAAAKAAPTCGELSAQIKRMTRQLRKARAAGKTSTVRRLRKQLRKLKQQLAGCQGTPFIEMVTVGNPGNPVDSGNTAAPDVYGAVAATFQIGKYEVTLDEYTAFLNAVAATDTYELYQTTMASDQQIAGIQRNGSPGSHTYSVIGGGRRPVTCVDWFDAARFCNWLHNGRPRGLQGAGTTETGAYTLNGATSGVSFTREPSARFWIPSEDEWYKAAYHHPTAAGGPVDEYDFYPTMSDTAPGNQVGGTPNQLNAYTTVYSVTQAPAPALSTQNYLTEAGAFSASPSYYGTFDQGGNVWEWTEGINGGARVLRGSSWDNTPAQALSSYRGGLGEREDTIGFRVATSAP